MRFMIIVKATKDSEAGVMPSAQLRADMDKFNQELMLLTPLDFRQVPRARELRFPEGTAQ
jgi:hypothetical protein